MATLHPSAYDFKSTFPVPRDADMRRAGRQGLLDQKESRDVSDGDWVAFQHQCWAAEMQSLHGEVRYLKYAAARGIDPATGRTLRNPQHWPQRLQHLQREIRRIEARLHGLLGDYSNYFDWRAADAFGQFVIEQSSDAAALPAQAELF